MATGWMMREVSGAEVRAIVDGKAGDPVTHIEPDMEIACPTIMGNYERTVVRKESDGDGFYAESEYNVYSLEMADDERNCWVTHGAINKKCIQKLKT